ncbi:hypothetical protein SAMN04487936_11567 [Halobacillus dabanensis]|uniref:Uncharacterized protein n=1 Tax=Halobacillus dabanensis TaxID=240302 RepID=A0A1I3ZZ61_HALDA|nr:hypothetical protein [Halobacillus dabanensis]SFK49375.1 hypothetical protein SAMN04487936_11567 [Halobacillus dabanensis]
MYRIIRRLDDGGIETLKNTGTTTPKTLTDYKEAKLLANKLNSIEHASTVDWTVERIKHPVE